NIELDQQQGAGWRIRDPRPDKATLSQGDWTWLRSGYFLQWRTPTTTDPNDGSVVITIFSAPSSLRKSFEHLLPRSNWEQAILDPFNLLVVVLDNMFDQVDENAILQSASPKAAETNFDFIGIHNVAKHIIYLEESSSAAFSTANRICEAHRELMEHSSLQQAHTIAQGVQGLLEHKRTLIEGCVIRSQCLEKRVQRMVNLVMRTEILFGG
ncbi:MAG: hypothetical protein Q9187_003024, partial [Circinaria calcarea]